MRKIIINGANGYVAANFINQLLLQDFEVIALVRENKHSPEDRMQATLLEMSEGEPVDRKNLTVYGYSLDEENLSIPANELAHIFSGQVDYLHFAASLKYDSRSKTEIFKTNLIGLENSIRGFLKNAGEGSRFFFISTAYSCGKFSGVFEEKFYQDDEISSFRNYYEQSKRLAENIVKKYRDEAGLNGYILRLSQVVGNKETGVTKTDYGIFDFAKRIYGVAKRYPNKTIRVCVDPNSTQNLIPIDTVVSYLVRTVETPKVPVIMNFVSKNSITNSQIVSSLNKRLPIQIVPIKGLARTDMDTFEQIISKGMSFTISYTDTNLSFDTTNLDSVMKGIVNEIDEQAVDKMLNYFIDGLSGKRGKEKLGFAV